MEHRLGASLVRGSLPSGRGPFRRCHTPTELGAQPRSNFVRGPCAVQSREPTVSCWRSRPRFPSPDRILLVFGDAKGI
jgi:hypothetical protein